jgi:hypothetical protein
MEGSLKIGADHPTISELGVHELDNIKVHRDDRDGQKQFARVTDVLPVHVPPPVLVMVTAPAAESVRCNTFGTGSASVTPGIAGAQEKPVAGTSVRVIGELPVLHDVSEKDPVWVTNRDLLTDHAYVPASVMPSLT